MSDRPQSRRMAWVLAAECVWRLVPWQARQYGRFDFEMNENLVIWMGAPLAYLAARAAWKRSPGLPAVTVLAKRRRQPQPQGAWRTHLPCVSAGHA